MKIKNYVKAVVKDENGDIVKVQKAHNTITVGSPSTSNNGLVMALNYITAKDDEDYDSTSPVNKMKLGTGTPSNDGLGAPTGVYKTTAFVGNFDITTLTAPKITLKGTWDASDGALSGITEVGLFSNDALGMFAYKTFTPALSKSASGTLDIEWQLTAS